MKSMVGDDYIFAVRIRDNLYRLWHGYGLESDLGTGDSGCFDLVI